MMDVIYFSSDGHSGQNIVSLGKTNNYFFLQKIGKNSLKISPQKSSFLFLLGGGQSGSGVKLEENDIPVVDGVVPALLAVLAGGLKQEIRPLKDAKITQPYIRLGKF
jgi:hypothetical protein